MDLIKQWADTARTWALCRLMVLVLGVVAAASATATLYLAKRPPVVVVKECGREHVFTGQYKPVKLTGEAVEGFVRNFVKMRYTWEAFDPEKVVRSVSCMVTEGLRKKLLAALTGQKRTTSQYVGRVRVVLQDGVSLALFDRIVLIDKGKPLALGERVELGILRGKPTPCNPTGLLVNSIKEVR